ncbi:hypothetical protein L6452_19629 [Arctium lappa]|uniref:Uncharacterized protein n=1 Tax=Arctium lappa TaxID=4217 RepID=A0ACB9B8D2_ARCLA|nr:hypothetical protein L6452_19629 [Arctium lappa]
MANMIKESMTVFWEFLHADKDTTNLFLDKIFQGSKEHLQDPADYELFMDIKIMDSRRHDGMKMKLELEEGVTLPELRLRRPAIEVLV